jgi:hypothetical protein
MFSQHNMNQQQFQRGYVKLSSKIKDPVPYVAVIFTDPQSRTDRSNRTIPHEIAIVGEDSYQFEDFDSIKEKVWEVLSDVYSELYELQSNEIENIELLRDRDSLKISHKKSSAVERGNEDKKGSNFQMAIAVVVLVIAIAVLLTIYLLNQKPAQLPLEKPRQDHLELNQDNQNPVPTPDSSPTPENPNPNQDNQNPVPTSQDKVHLNSSPESPTPMRSPGLPKTNSLNSPKP